jgi:hypothetical protein
MGGREGDGMGRKDGKYAEVFSPSTPQFEGEKNKFI